MCSYRACSAARHHSPAHGLPAQQAAHHAVGHQPGCCIPPEALEPPAVRCQPVGPTQWLMEAPQAQPEGGGGGGGEGLVK